MNLDDGDEEQSTSNDNQWLLCVCMHVYRKDMDHRYTQIRNLRQQNSKQ